MMFGRFGKGVSAARPGAAAEAPQRSAIEAAVGRNERCIATPSGWPSLRRADLAEIEVERLRPVGPERLRIADLFPPVLEQPQQAIHFGGVGRVAGQVLLLGRVVLQVEEL